MCDVAHRADEVHRRVMRNPVAVCVRRVPSAVRRTLELSRISAQLFLNSGPSSGERFVKVSI